MAVVKGLLSGIATVVLYLIGLLLVVGNVEIPGVMAEFSKLDAALFLQSDQMIALFLVTFFVLVALPLLELVIRPNWWLGVFILVASLITSLLLAGGIMTFEDKRLLVITSALLGSSVLSLVPLSAISLVALRNQKSRLEKVANLQKLQILQPERLLFRSTKQFLSRYVSIAFAVTYSGFLYFYSMYSDIALREVVNSVVYSLSFFVAASLYVVGYVRSVKRLLQ